MNTSNPGSRLLSRAEVAQLFGVSPSTVTRWADAGMLPSVKTLGGHRRYDSAAVKELAQRFLKEEMEMEELVLGVPAMYADHHVLAVRNALLGLPGVDEVQASAAFKTVRIDAKAWARLEAAAKDLSKALGRKVSPETLFIAGVEAVAAAAKKA